MRRIGTMIIALIVMVLVSLLCLGIVSVFSYMYKWQADKALVGITITYILAAFTGGITQKFLNKEKMSMGRKMLDGIFTGLIFIGILLTVSVFIAANPFVLSTRFLMILMLVMGSTCLGRIL